MIPDYCEAITAYRCWDVFPNGLLVGQAVKEPWVPYAANAARCASVSEPHKAAAHIADGRWLPAPIFGCDCGAHAYKTQTRAHDRFLLGCDTGSWTAFPDDSEDRVWGVVKIWGRVIEHQDGYRAEFAYPSELWSDNEQLALKIAALYGVPCSYEKRESKTKKRRSIFEDAMGVSSWLMPNWSSPYSSPYAAPVSNPVIPTPNIPNVGAIQIASPSIVRALGGDRHQQRRAVQKIQNQKDWRDILKSGLHACANNPDADKMTVSVQA